MSQGVLPFQYQAEKTGKGMTAFGGLGVYLDFLYGAGVPQKADAAIHLRPVQGHSDGQMVLALVLLNLVGGEAVQGLQTLEEDEGLMVLLRRAEQGNRGRDPSLRGRWRRQRQRTLPSPTAVFRYLEGFVGEDERCRGMGQAFIPRTPAALAGLREVNTHLVAQVQQLRPVKTATLDMDATLVETHKQEALWSYQGTKAYQPLQVYWAEQDLLVHTEFRDGNVPAGHEQCRVLKEALATLPPGVQEVRLRSDTAGYQQELLRYCAEGKHPAYGVIRFAVGADVTEAFRQAVCAVPEEEWRPLGEGQEWAETVFVPEWAGRKKSSPDYRYLAVRETVRQGVLPGMEGQLPFPTLVSQTGRLYKVTGIITNLDLPGPDLIHWYRQRCGKSEEVHRVLKDDLAGGILPSGSFGENAAWWAMAALSYNVHTAVKGLALGEGWANKRLKTIRFQVMTVPGRIMERGRRLFLRIREAHPALPVLLEGRGRLRALCTGPPG